jgi:nitrite reductase (NADH) small subunit
MQFTDVTAVSEIAEGRPRRVQVAGRDLVICRTADGIFALDNRCPHRGGPLSEGDLLGSEIVCPWHLWGFDVASGACTGNGDIMISTYQTRIEDGRLLVAVAPVHEPMDQEK